MSERAFWKTRAIKCAKWLQTLWLHPLLSYPTQNWLARLARQSFENAPRFARRRIRLDGTVERAHVLRWAGNHPLWRLHAKPEGDEGECASEAAEIATATHIHY